MERLSEVLARPGVAVMQATATMDEEPGRAASQGESAATTAVQTMGQAEGNLLNRNIVAKVLVRKI